MGDGWLIFGLPPSEVAFHPSKKNDLHELYLLCDNVEQLVSELKKSGVKCDKVETQTWGYLTKIKLPGGGKLAVYQPLHERPETVVTKVSKRKPPARNRR